MICRHWFFAFAGALSLLAASSAVDAQSHTTITGTGTPFTNLQDSLALNFVVPSYGIFPSEDGSYPYVMGHVRLTAASYQPAAYAADGRFVAISQNQALFSLLGTNFGGDGVFTFAVPDLAGRTPVGAGQAPGLSNWVVGETRGTAETTLTSANLPQHIHALFDADNNVTGHTEPFGGSQPFDNIQPSLGLNYLIATDGIFPNSQSGNVPPMIGQVAPYAGGNIPGGWLVADGSLLEIEQNTALFSILGTTYGGNGQTTFALPDLRGRTIIGAGSSERGTFVLGEELGTEDINLLPSQMPIHNHVIEVPSEDPFEDPTITLTGYAGGGQPIDNTQPSLALNYAIVTEGIYPSQGGLSPDDFQIGEIVAFAGNFVPGGMLPADGSLLPIEQYAALYSLLGTIYGGDGETTFALPDLRGRIVVGAGPSAPAGTVNSLRSFAAATLSGPDCDCTCPSYPLGDTPGNSNPKLNLNNLPAHGHDVPEPGTWLLATLGALGLAALGRKGRS